VGSLGQQSTRLPGFQIFFQFGGELLVRGLASGVSSGLAADGECGGLPASQEIVDRIAARVENDIILLSDIRMLSRLPGIP